MTSSPPTTMPDFCDRHHPVRINTAIMTLLRMGVDLERIDILADGESENYRGEIRHQDPQPGETIGPDTKVVLRVGSFGGFDHLPFQFFFGLESHGLTRSSEWEERGRRLMAPFDAASVRSLGRTQYEELRFNQGFADRKHLMRFLKLFGLEWDITWDEMPTALLWLAMLPSFHAWAGNAKQVERALEALFGYRFIIRESQPRTYAIPPNLCYHLGADGGRLGHETVLGDSFRECDSAYELVVKAVSANDIHRFLPGQELRGRLEKVLDLCLPSHLERVVRIEPASRITGLGAEPSGTYLGYNAFA
jgi:hypothetical protein